MIAFPGRTREPVFISDIAHTAVVKLGGVGLFYLKDVKAPWSDIQYFSFQA